MRAREFAQLQQQYQRWLKLQELSSVFFQIRISIGHGIKPWKGFKRQKFYSAKKMLEVLEQSVEGVFGQTSRQVQRRIYWWATVCKA